LLRVSIIATHGKLVLIKKIKAREKVSIQQLETWSTLFLDYSAGRVYT
jgi:hypothetical protein